MSPAAKRSVVAFPAYVRLEPIVEIVRAAIWSGRIGFEKPVSLILIAEQESAKTEVLKHFTGTPTIKYLSDLTGKGMLPIEHRIKSGEIRHIVLLDLVRVVNHNPKVTNRTIQILATYCEEGEQSTSDGGGLIERNDPLQAGCITSITPSYYKLQQGGWRKSGFLSRFLGVRYCYTNETVNSVHKAISNGHQFPRPNPCPLPPHAMAVSIPPKYNLPIEATGKRIGDAHGVHGFRFHRALRRLLKAEALRNERSIVNDSDLAKVLSWAAFFGPDEVQL